MLYLRQATSATIAIGPYVGSNGVALTGLTLTQSTFMLSKNGAALVAKNESTSGSHQAMGLYSVMFNETDTGSLGRLVVISSAQAALPVLHEYTVLPTSVFDSLVLGSNLLQISARQLENTVITSATFAVSGVERLANIFSVDIRSISVSINDRSPANALRALRNRVTSSGTVMTIYAENDSTAVWTGALTVNNSAGFIVEVDPA